MNSLGKPAEVLILPSRDRRIPKVPKEERNTTLSRTTLQEAIDSETASLSLNELAENIEQVRSLVGKLRGQLEAQEWATLKKHLMSGFTHDQLKKYILLKKQGGMALADLPPFLRDNKLATARYLVEEVWGFTAPQQDDSSRQQPNRKKVKLGFVLSAAKIDHLLMCSSQFLKRIAEDLNVLIEVSMSDRKIKASGNMRDVQEALKRLSRAAKDLSSKTINFRAEFGSTFEEPSMKDHLKAFLKSVQQKYQNLTITLGVGSITIVTPRNVSSAEQAQRDILLSVPTESEAPPLSIWPPKEIAATTLLPTPTPPELPATLQRFPWYRRVVPSPASQPSKRSASDAKKLEPLYSTLEDRVKRSIDPVTAIPKPVERSGLFLELSAAFGQVLCRDPNTAADNDSSKIAKAVAVTEAERDSEQLKTTDSNNNDATGASGQLQKEQAVSSQLMPVRGNTRFVGGAPFSTQQVAMMDPWNQDPKAMPKDTDEHARTILRLQLSPMSESPSAPTFEVFLTSGESTEGKSAPLHILRASAIHREKCFNVLCPQGQVDVQFTQQLKQDLFYPNSSHSDNLKSFHRALRGYVDRAQKPKSPEWVFQPFVSLPIHYTLWGVQARVQNGIKHGKTYAEPDLKAWTKQRGKQGEVSEEKVQYLLRTVDVLDVDSRSWSSGSARTPPRPGATSVSPGKLCLDHIMLTGTDATRQELRLAQRSVLDAPTLTQPKISTFLRTALKLAEQFGHDPKRMGA